MADVHTKKQRSKNMAAIRSKNTKPELKVRSFLHKNGFRFRLKTNYLPCKPDIILPKYKAVVFVNGCFWHRHGCEKTTTPKTNIKFWKKKFSDNINRDKKNIGKLTRLGWKTFIVWECEISTTHLHRLVKIII